MGPRKLVLKDDYKTLGGGGDGERNQIHQAEIHGRFADLS